MSMNPHHSRDTPQTLESTPPGFPSRTPQVGGTPLSPNRSSQTPRVSKSQTPDDTPNLIPGSGAQSPPIVGSTDPEAPMLFGGSYGGTAGKTLSGIHTPGRNVPEIDHAPVFSDKVQPGPTVPRGGTGTPPISPPRGHVLTTSPEDPAGSIGQQTPSQPRNILQVALTATPAQLPASAGATPVLSIKDINDRRNEQYKAQRSSHIPLNGAGEDRARTLVLCFDGTGNKFGKNSNVVRFFDALKKSDSDKKEQLTYYQPGIGTYLKSRYITTLASQISTKFDEAVAIDLPDHVKSGYRFLMQNYQDGDKICLFGFSRGAYTARALAGMIYKVGLLPPDNAEQLEFAFATYKGTGDGEGLGGEFKRIFARRVMIDFIGVWDTVSSVGIIPRSLPYSTYNDGVKVFRHALALDERRARFRPNIWGEPVSVRQELDEEPYIEGRGDIPRDDWVYRPPDLTHVKEVWFTGCHADVGGGSHPKNADDPSSLSNIPLRWMIKECFLAGTGILFDDEILRDVGFKDPKQLCDSPATFTEESPDTSVAIGDGDGAVARAGDHLAKIFDQLLLCWYLWWFLELIPMLTTHQLEHGWLRIRQRNFGRGRYMAHADGQVLVHKTVQGRMDQNKGYTPAAYNWGENIKLGVVKWVE